MEGQKSEVPTLELSDRILHFDYINNKGGSASYIDNDNKNMSKSHQQFLPQKSVLSALQRHSRTRSNRFLEDKVPMESLLAKGKEHYHEKRVEQACACFQQVWTQMKSPTPEVAYLLGLTLMGVQNYPRAIPCFEYLESKYPFYK